jgi:ubiquitin
MKTIIVKEINGVMTEIEVDSSDSIALVKNKIQDVRGYPLDEMRMIFFGKLLQDERTLEDYSIANGTIIHLVMKSQLRQVSQEPKNAEDVQKKEEDAPKFDDE